MLEELPAGALDEWYDYYRLEPWGDDWERMAVGATTLANEIRTVACAFSGGKFEPIEVEHLVPYRNDKQHQEQTQAAIEALDAMTGL